MTASVDSGGDAPGNLGAMEKAIKRGYHFRIGDSYQRFRHYVDLQELCDRVLALDGSESGTFNIITGKSPTDSSKMNWRGNTTKRLKHSQCGW